MLRRELGQPRNVVEANVQAVLEVESVRDARLQEFLPVTGKVAALRDDADECRIRVVGQRVLDRADDGDAVVGLAGTLGIEHRHNGLAPVAHHAARSLGVVRVVRELLGEDHVSLRRRFSHGV